MHEIEESMSSSNTDVTSNQISRKDRVAYVWNNDIINWCDKLEKVKGRAKFVHCLIFSYRFHHDMKLISPVPASKSDLCTFHSNDYIDYLQSVNDDEAADHCTDETAEQYGLTYDCSIFPGVYDYSCHIAGSSLTAAKRLTSRKYLYAINWSGGWHHGKRDEASGFCYINDVVVAILYLLTEFARVLYVDLDLHHGDGVEDAFSISNKVMTVSCHKFGHGFYPGTGKLDDVGYGKGKYYTVNIPLQEGCQDDTYTYIMDKVLDKVRDIFRPEVVVCQCGADGLTSDPHRAFNLTSASLVHTVRHIKQWQLPMLITGGGGYNLIDTAKCWTQITATMLDKTINTDIPEHCLFEYYGPDYTLDVSPSLVKDSNTAEHIHTVIDTILANLHQLS